MAVLEVRGLTKHFEVRPGFLGRVFGHHDAHVIKAVHDVSFSIGEGEILGLAGESGCGKSTTCLLITRLLEPSSGEIRFKDQPIAGLSGAELKDFRRRVQMIFQDPYESLNPRFTVLDLIAEGPRALGLWDAKETEERSLAMLADVGLKPDEYKARYPHEMSGGERQRVGIASALVMEPELVVADEPLSMLDVSIRAGILDLLRGLSERLGFSCLYVSHDLSILSNIADRLMVMYLGTVAEIGPVEEVIAAPRHPYTTALVEAVPAPDPRYRRPIPKIHGDIARPVDPPPGCRFAGRCPNVAEVCRSDPIPALRTMGPAHLAACHRVEGHQIEEVA
ncbi:MAG: ATP-binding cassette domain-containing protein [Kiloniellales bacterium]|nr:ATP-binding cassette domain-containing protein [Kiloniellales bacterium]